MKLLSVYAVPAALDVLFQILQEREPHESISHRAMPTRWEHAGFVQRRPYLAWYIVEVAENYVGAVYLSKQREIGVGILKEFRGQGYGRQAVQLLMAAHPGRFLANINPANQKSINMFASLGFGHIQNTYEREIT